MSASSSRPSQPDRFCRGTVAGTRGGKGGGWEVGQGGWAGLFRSREGGEAVRTARGVRTRLTAGAPAGGTRAHAR
jgi:hypothetical protein